MTLALGTVPAGSTLYIPFSSYAGSTGASVTLTGLAVTDIEIFKNGSTTQRASDAGYALLDTDGIDFDGITGIHGFSIDLSDNTDSGFFAVGSQYWVVVSAVTVDSQTVNFIAAVFRIGPAESVAGYPKVDVSHYGGTAGTFASGRPEVNTTHAAGTAWGSGAITAASIAADAITAAKIADGAIDAATFAAGAINAAAIASDAITDAKVASDVTIASVTGAVGSVTGAVGSVTGNVGGNVTGSVGSIATGGIAATSFAAGAIDAAAIAADAITDAKVAADVTIASVTGAVGSVTAIVTANMTQISGDSVAADNLEAALDGTGGVTISAALTGNITGDLSGSVGSVTGAVGSVTAMVTANVIQISGDSVAADNLESYTDGTTPMPVNVTQISGDATAADNLEAAADGTGYNLGGGSVVAASVTGAVGSVTGAVGSVTGAVGSVTGNVGGNVSGSVGSVTGNVSGNVTGSVGSVATGGITRASLAADTGLQTVRSNTAQAGAATTITLDASASATDGIYNNHVVYLTGGTGAGQARFITDYVGATKVATVATWTTNPDNTSTFAILPFDAIPGASAPTAAQVADAVWDELLSGHAVSGSTGEALSAAGTAGDPWLTALPGAYGAGTAGKIIGDNINATISSRATQTSVDTIDDFLDTEVADIQARLPAALTGAGNMKVDVLAISGDTIAADNAEAFFDGTGYAGTNNVIPTVTAVTTVNGLAANVITAAATAADFTTEIQSGLATAAALATVDTVADGIKAKTDSLTFTVAGVLDANVTDWKGTTAPAMTGDAFARLGAPAGASVSADVAAVKTQTAAIETDTQDIQGRIPAALVNGQMDSTNSDTVVRGTVGAASTTTSIVTSAFSPSGAAADQMKGRIVIFDNDTATAALRGQATDITASSNASTPVLTVTALTTAPASGDTFTIV
jgi:hypothetical protein